MPGNNDISKDIFYKLLEQVFNQISESNQMNVASIKELSDTIKALIDREKDIQRDIEESTKKIEKVTENMNNTCLDISKINDAMGVEKESDEKHTSKIEKVDEKVTKLSSKVSKGLAILGILFTILTFTYIFVKSSIDHDIKNAVRIEMKKYLEEENGFQNN